jgi:hypothetical protein
MGNSSSEIESLTKSQCKEKETCSSNIPNPAKTTQMKPKPMPGVAPWLVNLGEKPTTKVRLSTGKQPESKPKESLKLQPKEDLSKGHANPEIRPPKPVSFSPVRASAMPAPEWLGAEQIASLKNREEDFALGLIQTSSPIKALVSLEADVAPRFQNTEEPSLPISNHSLDNRILVIDESGSTTTSTDIQIIEDVTDFRPERSTTPIGSPKLGLEPTASSEVKSNVVSFGAISLLKKKLSGGSFRFMIPEGMVGQEDTRKQSLLPSNPKNLFSPKKNDPRRSLSPKRKEGQREPSEFAAFAKNYLGDKSPTREEQKLALSSKKLVIEVVDTEEEEEEEEEEVVVEESFQGSLQLLIVVEKILDMKKSDRGDSLLIKWLGYPDEDNTWELWADMQSLNVYRFIYLIFSVGIYMRNIWLEWKQPSNLNVKQ